MLADRVVHGLGTGSDAKTTWMLALTAGCGLAVLVAVWVRAVAGWPERSGLRASAVLASIAAPLALVAWLPSGPLASGWAKHSGTPASLLPTASASAASAFAASSARTSATTSAATPSGASSSRTGSSGAPAPTAFTSQVSGTVKQSQLSGGRVRVDLKLKLPGQSLRELEIRIDGRPLSGGGVAMTASTVTSGTSSNPALYRGRITGLEGANVAARVRSAQGSLALLARLQIDPRSGTVTGTMSARPGERTEGGA